MGALCRGPVGEPLAVVAADRMVTLGSFIEFEHTVPKMAQPSPSAVVMIAGDTLRGTALARGVVSEFSGGAPTIAEIAGRLAQRYVEMRRDELEFQILSPRGLDLASLYGAHQALNPQLIMVLDQQMSQYNLGVELLVAGVDAEGAHLYSVQNPGQPASQNDVIGYAAIGSGGIHGVQAMIGFRHAPSTDLRETVFQVYASKRRAEHAPGVGLDTDLAIVSQEDGVNFLGPAALKKLADLYDTYERTTEDFLVKGLQELSLDDGDDDGN